MADAFIGEVRAVGFNYVPEGWLACDGRVYQVPQYQALFSVIGNAFGGNGPTTFATPNLQGRVANSQGTDTSGTERAFAGTYGTESVTLTATEGATHIHSLNAALSTVATASVTAPSNNYLGHSVANKAETYVPGTPAPALAPMASAVIGQSGAAAPAAHENRQPFLVMNYIINYDGMYPVRS